MVSAAARYATARRTAINITPGVSRWALCEAIIGYAGATKRYRAVVWEHEHWTRNGQWVRTGHRVSTSVHGDYAILNKKNTFLDY